MKSFIVGRKGKTKKEDWRFKQRAFYVLLAFELIMSYSLMGYMEQEPITVTMMHLPVLIGARYLGTKESTILGAIFGVTSMWKASTYRVASVDYCFSPFLSKKPIESIILSIVTRILYGLITGLIFERVNKKKRTPFFLWLIAMICFGIHGMLVTVSMLLFFPEIIVQVTDFRQGQLTILILVTYVIPATVTIILDYIFSLPYVKQLIAEAQEVMTNPKKPRGQREIAIHLSVCVVIVMVLLLGYVYSRTIIILGNGGIRLSQAIKNHIFQLHIQLFVSVLALFYLAYQIIKVISRFSEERKQEVKELNKLLAENENYKVAIEKVLEEVKEASEAKSQFISRMSHDIRTPLNAIIGLSSIGKEDGKREDKHYEYFDKICSSGNYLLELVNDSLDLSRIENDAVEFHIAPFSITKCIEDIYIIMGQQIRDKHIAFSYRTNGDSNQLLMLDAMRVKQVFMNLISNAVKFTNEGGKVEVQTSIEILSDGKGKLISYVRDTGIGMSKEFMKIMYEPYRQEDVKNESIGAGLGLAIVKNLVERMNGTIEVKSELLEGTEFHIEIICDLAKEMDLTKRSRSLGKVNLFGKRILLVEDNDINIQVACIMLGKKGVMVEVAHNGKEAILLYSQKEEGYYDAILMDIYMPIMNGLTATREIRAFLRADAKNIPIIGMSANAMEKDKKEALVAGMNAYVTKPIVPEQLYQVLSDACNKI